MGYLFLITAIFCLYYASNFNKSVTNLTTQPSYYFDYSRYFNFSLRAAVEQFKFSTLSRVNTYKNVRPSENMSFFTQSTPNNSFNFP